MPVAVTLSRMADSAQLSITEAVEKMSCLAAGLPSLVTVVSRIDRAAAVPALTIGAIFGACLASMAAGSAAEDSPEK
eukprot:COSAG06_NODE_1207_length_10262_cov_14.644396_11_plen_77_part_00